MSRNGTGTRPERDELLKRAEIVIAGSPFPLNVRSRSPRIKWMHQNPAGASNLHGADIWNSDVIVTTSRGYGEVTAIVEYAIAGLLYFAKSFDQAIIDSVTNSFQRSTYAARSAENKTLCVVGAGWYW